MVLVQNLEEGKYYFVDDGSAIAKPRHLPKHVGDSILSDVLYDSGNISVVSIAINRIIRQATSEEVDSLKDKAMGVLSQRIYKF